MDSKKFFELSTVTCIGMFVSYLYLRRGQDRSKIPAETKRITTPSPQPAWVPLDKQAPEFPQDDILSLTPAELPSRYRFAISAVVPRYYDSVLC